jgi:hypothetical protein
VGGFFKQAPALHTMHFDRKMIIALSTKRVFCDSVGEMHMPMGCPRIFLPHSRVRACAAFEDTYARRWAIIAFTSSEQRQMSADNGSALPGTLACPFVTLGAGAQYMAAVALQWSVR